MKRSLDLGCGLEPRNTFSAEEVHGIDIRGEASDLLKIADLAIEDIPYPDGFFDYVTAYDFIEHVPRVVYMPHKRNCFVELMNEVHRVLKDGGVFFSFTPAFPHAAAFQDPTHVNIITEQTFPSYFDDQNRWASMYGFTGRFQVIQQAWRGQHLGTLMQKVPGDGTPLVPTTWRLT